MHDSRIDLSALDPARDVGHWSQLVDSVAARGLARRKQQLTVSYQMLSWARPVLAIAAAVTLVVGAREWLSHPDRSSLTRRRVEPAYVLATWAAKDERPSTSNILLVLVNQNATE